MSHRPIPPCIYADVQHDGGNLHIEIARIYVGLVGCCSVRVFESHAIGNRCWCGRMCVCDHMFISLAFVEGNIYKTTVPVVLLRTYHIILTAGAFLWLI